jgi:hypothetical protein
MMELISMNWHENRDNPDDPKYELVPENKEFEALTVSVSMADEKERSARAKLIEKAFRRARELGIDETRLRFHV